MEVCLHGDALPWHQLMQIIDDYSRGDLTAEEVESRLAHAPIKTFQYSFHSERALTFLGKGVAVP